MNRELAESFVQYQIDQSSQDKKSLSIGIFCFIGFWFLILLFYHTLVFCLVAVFVILIYSIIFILYCKKPKITSFFLLTATFGFCIAILMNGMYFAIYKLTVKFVWYEYVLFLVIQLLSFCVTIPLTVFIANKHDKNKKAINGAVWASLGGGIGAISYMTGRLWAEFTNPGIDTILTLCACLFIIASWLISYSVSRSAYCIILIKKYNLLIYNKYNIKTEPVKTENELQNLTQEIDKDETDEHNSEIL